MGAIVAAMRDAHRRAGVSPHDIGLVLAHGTGTALNDPTETAALDTVFAGAAPGPLMTVIKSAIGHTSGSAALMSLPARAGRLGGVRLSSRAFGACEQRGGGVGGAGCAAGRRAGGS
ncbi:hypothetical protein GCM10009680_19520 [Streptomyces yatensis]|uniref:Beta-ketoacyl synthase C-terminal domain-containing protein n=1 Tax=Streptomyces yatensis TaxID=155177 RepID=A0ABN2H170_9ACTN